jgi:hypothetical protein
MRDQSGIEIDWRPDRTAFDLRLRGEDGKVTQVLPLPAERYPQLLRALDTARYLAGVGAGPHWTRIVLNCLTEPRDDYRIDDLLRRDAEAIHQPVVMS